MNIKYPNILRNHFHTLRSILATKHFSKSDIRSPKVFLLGILLDLQGIILLCSLQIFQPFHAHRGKITNDNHHENQDQNPDNQINPGTGFLTATFRHLSFQFLFEFVIIHCCPAFLINTLIWHSKQPGIA